VYSSLPLVGVAKPQAQAIVRGATLAWEDHGKQAAGLPVRYVSLSDGTRRAGTWTPERTSLTARRAAQDRTTIAYIGEFNSGASAISIPILNEAGIAQISPSNQAVGLTRSGPGADRGEPEKYYPTGRRHYVRVIPNDRVQGGALAQAMRSQRCRRVAALDDGEVYGAGLGALVRRYADRVGLRVVAQRRISRRSNFAGVARAVARRRPDCTVFTGITSNGAVRLFEALARELPRAKLFGGDGIAEAGFTNPRFGGISRRVGRRVFVTVAALAPSAYSQSGRQLLRRYRDRFGAPPDPYALYGYEAMDLALDAVDAAGPDQTAVIRWLLRSANDRDSPLGRYSIDRHGDTTERRYGLYRPRNGRLYWDRAVRAPAG
jgi:branched-chain amino acid transport system substrate-binding protein